MDWIAVNLSLIRAIMFIWDFITFPIYQLIYRPWKKRESSNETWSRVVRKNDSEIVYESRGKISPRFAEIEKARCDTIDKIWCWVVRKNRDRLILGTRKIINVENEKSGNKALTKLSQGEYNWKSYEDCDAIVNNLCAGLTRRCGLQTGSKIAMYADTCMDWFLIAQACFKCNFTLVTLYTNLGEDSIAQGIAQTEPSVVVVSHYLLPKLRSIMSQIPTIRTVIYIPHQIEDADVYGFPSDVSVISSEDLMVDAGNKKDLNIQGPTPSDMAIIMYTSGSTGTPKGVMLSHKNLVAMVQSYASTLDMKTGKNDSYLAYLPLAHVLELLSEVLMFIYGVKIGYSNPNTITDSSTMVKSGTSGDATVLRPTIMAAVPLVLDRIYKAISVKISGRSQFFRRFFNMCFDYRLKSIRNGEDTPIMNLLIFRKMKEAVGGRLRLIYSGGAPLSPEIHDYLRVCLGVPLIQGYGLTETTAAATVMTLNDLSAGTVGPPNQLVQLKLINWEEGNYRVTDKPRPRGEIVIGGDMVAKGYYKMPEKSEEDFYDDSGRRWFQTGDIGEVNNNGTLRIIDRKKDLVKLQLGEYVSLGKVESVLKISPLVENVCVYGDPSKTYCVALVVLNRPEFAKLVAEFGREKASQIIDNESAFFRACEDKTLIEAVHRRLVEHGRRHKLAKFEIPGAVTLCKEPWGPETGLVTAAFKLKRKPIQLFYQKDLDTMYGSSRGV